MFLKLLFRMECSHSFLLEMLFSCKTGGIMAPDSVKCRAAANMVLQKTPRRASRRGFFFLYCLLMGLGPCVPFEMSGFSAAGFSSFF